MNLRLVRWTCHFFPALLLMATGNITGQTPPNIAPNYPIYLETVPSSLVQSLEGPMPVDLDADGRPEIVVASGRKLYVFKLDGSPLPGWPQATKLICHNSPAIGDLDGDGDLDIVTFDRDGPTRRSFLYAWDYRGTLLPGFPIEPGYGDYAVTLYDLDHDGTLEIIASFGRKPTVFHHDGRLAEGWPQSIDPFYPSSKAAIGDLDADGVPEIVITGQLMGSPDWGRDSRGRVYAWKPGGEMVAGWPAETPAGHLYSGHCNPLLVDVDLDGFLEIAVGTFSFAPPNRVAMAALYRHDGSMMPGWPLFAAGDDSLESFIAAPSAADLDGDGMPELIFASRWEQIIAWNGDGSLVPGWPVILSQVDSTLIYRTVQGNPSIGDLDGDGRLEVVVDNNQAEMVEGVWRGKIFAFNDDGTHVSWSPLRPRQFSGLNTLAMTDLNGDGFVELVAVSGDVYDNETWLTVWQVPEVPYDSDRFPWPMFGHDRWHTSRYGFEPPDTPVTHVTSRAQNGLPTSFELQQSFPNPFWLSNRGMPSRSRFTEIPYGLPEPAEVRLRIYDLLGATVRTLVAGRKPAGRHLMRWNGTAENGSAVASGVYLYVMEVEPFSHPGSRLVQTRKLLAF